MPTAPTDTARPPTAVLIHHFGGSRATWAAVMAELGDACVCVAADLRGFGGSGSAGRAFTVGAWADDVVARCDALAVGRMVVVGHSMGGRVAMAVAARRPERVAGVVLVAPSPLTPEPMTDAGRAGLSTARDGAFSAEQQVRHITGGSLSPDQIAAAAADVVTADPAAWAAWIDVGSRADLTGIAAAITCPVTVLSGDRDAAVPTAVVERGVVDRLPQAKLVRVPGAGHLLPVEAAAAVADAIRQMVAAVPAGPVVVASVRDLVDTDLVTPATRRALQERAAWRSRGPQFFTADELSTLAAVCDAMVPQDGADEPGGGRYRVDLAGEIDRSMAAGSGNGWRYDALPADGDAYRRGLAALDDLGRGPFHELSRPDRLEILTAIRAGTGDGPAWGSRGLSPKLLLEEWLAEAVEIYYSHAGGGYADLAYVGFADARGWRRVGLDQLEPQERLVATAGVAAGDPKGLPVEHGTDVRAAFTTPAMGPG